MAAANVASEASGRARSSGVSDAWNRAPISCSRWRSAALSAVCAMAANISRCSADVRAMSDSGSPPARLMSAPCITISSRGGDPRAGQQHQERHLRPLRRHHRRDQPALAVADDARRGRPRPPAARAASAPPPPRRARSPPRWPRQAAGGAPDAAVVHAQHGDAAARQVVGEHQERLVAQQRLVAVLRARAGDQHARRGAARRPAAA